MTTPPTNPTKKPLHPEYQYLKLLADILKNGKAKPSRGIHPTRSIFGAQLRFDLRHGFPLLTTKKTPFAWPLKEMLWFIKGDCQTPTELQQQKITIWDGFENASAVKEGTLGRIYGVQWRHWRRPDGTEFDQLAWAIDEVKNNPSSKAILVSGWNAGELGEMRLPPCHTLFQLDVIKGKLYMQLYQRSSDVLLGLPFNIAQYSALLMMMARLTDLEPREFIVTIGDAHLYTNQLAAAKEQVTRKPYPFPTLTIKGSQKTIDDFTFPDFTLENYRHHPPIKAPVVIV